MEGSVLSFLKAEWKVSDIYEILLKVALNTITLTLIFVLCLILIDTSLT
jgi:hypothetical protein